MGRADLCRIGGNHFNLVYQLCARGISDAVIQSSRFSIRPLRGADRSWPSWISARVRSLGPKRPVGSPDHERLNLTRRPRRVSSTTESYFKDEMILEARDVRHSKESHTHPSLQWVKARGNRCASCPRARRAPVYAGPDACTCASANAPNRRSHVSRSSTSPVSPSHDSG